MQRSVQAALLGLLLFAGAGEAQAISRYNALSMSCAAANAAARAEGAVILRYPSQKVRGMTLYERAVRSSAECGNYEYAETRFVTTSDAARCPILACAPATDDDWWLRP